MSYLGPAMLPEHDVVDVALCGGISDRNVTVGI